MCKPKNEGGMGFMDLKIFNKTLIAKKKLASTEKSRVSSTSTTNFIYSKLRSAPSYTWRGIWEAKSILYQGFCWRVGDNKYMGR